jgi:hypothetical protein|eukprot:COSAG02_NODE_1828_length_10742_cov_3.513013_11_plen_333_part_00
MLAVLNSVAASAAQSPPPPLTLEHSGGGLISAVMESTISKLPPLEPSTPVRNATQLIRTVKLSGHYTADVVLRLPSYTRLQLDGSLTPIAELNAGNDTNVQDYLGTGMVYATGEMIGVEGGVFNCSGWSPSPQGLAHNGTTTLAGILFNSVVGGWITGAEVANCGCGSTVGPRPGYVSGNIWIRQGWGNSIEGVSSHHSCNRGVWAETVKLIVWGGRFNHNEADGLDFDAGTSKSVAYNNVCNNNSICPINPHLQLNGFKTPATHHSIPKCVQTTTLQPRTVDLSDLCTPWGRPPRCIPGGGCELQLDHQQHLPVQQGGGDLGGFCGRGTYQ